MVKPDDEVQHAPTRRYGEVRQVLPAGGRDEVVQTADLEPAEIPTNVRYGI